MSSGCRLNDSVEAGVSPAFQSSSHAARLPPQKDKITIREAVLNDAPEIAVLMCELGYETRRTEMETRLELILSNRAYKTFVAVMDGSVCGMIGTLTHYPSYEHNDPSGRILALVTLSAARRRGIGRALIATAEKDFAQRGIKRVAVNTQLTREDAHKFYESLGYERNGWRFVKQLVVSD
jgi:GNAT superfamily N-acetyltransferase